MYNACGFEHARSPFRLPNAPVSHEHPKETSMVFNPSRTMIKKKREGMCSGRSKRAITSASGNTQRFVQTQGRTDAGIDNPNVHIVNTRSQAGLGQSRGIARRIRNV